jgi:uncharacterized protein (DUF885 family)
LAIAGFFLLLPLSAKAQAKGDQMRAAKEFRAYLDADWKRWMELYPEFATAVGYPGENRHWTDNSPQGLDTRKAHLAESLKKLQSFSRQALPAGEQLNYDLYRGLLETAEEGLAYGDDPLPFRNVVPGNFWLPLNQMGGVQQALRKRFRRSRAEPGGLRRDSRATGRAAEERRGAGRAA